MFYKIIKQVVLGTLLTGVTCLNAQVLNITDETIIHEGKERSVVKVTIAPDSKDVKKSFKGYMDDRHDVDIEGIGFLKNKEVIYTEPTVIPSISTKKMELFAKVTENGNQTNMYVFGQIGYNNQITPSSNWVEYNAMKDLTIDFLNNLLPNYYQDIVEEQKDEVDDLEDNRDDMRKQINKNKEKISELQKENKQLERKIASIKVKLEQSMDTLKEKNKKLKKVNTKLDDSNKN